jgi:hypothetical protein
MGPTQPWALYPVFNRWRHSADLSLPSSAQVRNEWIYTSEFPICLQCAHIDNFTFTFPFAIKDTHQCSHLHATFLSTVLATDLIPVEIYVVCNVERSFISSLQCDALSFLGLNCELSLLATLWLIESDSTPTDSNNKQWSIVVFAETLSTQLI